MPKIAHRISKICTLIFFIFYVLSTNASTDIFSLFPIEHYNQNISDWISPTNADYTNPLLTQEQQTLRKSELYFHYFGKRSPWNADYIRTILSQQTPADLRSQEEQKIMTFSNENKPANKIVYGANFRPYSPQSFARIKNNINLEQFNTKKYQSSQRAIAINNISARLIPTDEPYFYNNQIAGEGYPFDNAQAVIIWAGTPLYILGETVDHLWAFVLTPSFIGWVKQIDIARVDSRFVSQWLRVANQNIAAITRTSVPIIDTENQLPRFEGYIGMIFPATKKSNEIQILIPVKDKNQQALIFHAKLNNQDVTLIPLELTPQHIIDILQQLIGRTYGWGGMYFYNDCSSELKNLYTIFGIWLPMHSSNQVDPMQVLGKADDISHLDAAMRSQYLMTQGHPWMTILYVGGHVILYLGNYPNPNDPTHPVVPLSYQDMWGLGKLNIPYRSVVGQSVLFPLLVSYPEDPTLVSQLNKPILKLFYLDKLPSIDEGIKMLNSMKINIQLLLSP